MATRLDESERHVSEVVRDFDERLGLRASSECYASLADRGESELSGRVILDDFSDIPFLDNIVGVEHYQLRSFLRAGDKDVCLATCPGVEGYQAYNRDLLGLGEPEFIRVNPGRHLPVAISKASGDAPTLDRLTRYAKQMGSVSLEPYMSIAPAWELADKIAKASGVPCTVVGPPPPITAFANNKAHVTAFSNALVTPLLGRDATVPTRTSTSVEGVVADLMVLAGTTQKVAIKLPRCASAMGNYIVEEDIVESLRRGERIQAERCVRRVLEEKDWDGQEPVLSVAWLDTPCSPSTQCWIPPLGTGRPYVDGVYEQLLIGPEKVFLGSVPARLDEKHVDWMVRVSEVVIHGYQQLGYVGRCSFDFIIHDDSPYLVECNGRWGGTSIPMQLLDRIIPGPRPAYRARDYVSEALRGVAFSDLLACLGDSLYDRRTGRGRFIVYNVGCLEPFGKFDVIALGDTQEDAGAYLEEELPKRLSQHFGRSADG